MPRAGAAGAVVPTPEGCQPVKNWHRVDDQEGKGVNWPSAGRRPVTTPREPMTTTRAAATQTASRTRPLTRPASVSSTPASASATSWDGTPGPAASAAAASSSAWAPWNPNWKTRRR